MKTNFNFHFNSVLVFFFYLHDSGFKRTSELHGRKTLWMPRLIADFTDEMWMRAVAAKQMKLLSFYPKKNFPSRPIKRLARQEVQPPCFLLS